MDVLNMNTLRLYQERPVEKLCPKVAIDTISVKIQGSRAVELTGVFKKGTTISLLVAKDNQG